jgi:hypothetical protein
MPVVCSDVLRNQASFTAWKADIASKISTYQSKGSATQQDRNDILVAENDILAVSLCMANSLNSVGGASSDIANLDQQILEMTQQLENSEADIKIAKDRVAYMRHPERNTSSYESWFPINRPISFVALITLISLSVFLAIFLILIAFSAFGMDLMLYINPAYINKSPLLLWIYQQFTTSFWIMVLVLISVVIYFMRRN